MSDVKALMIRNTSTVGLLDVYRDGEVVTVVSEVATVGHNDGGRVTNLNTNVRCFESIRAFEIERDRVAMSRFALAYTKVVSQLGIDDNPRNASPLPDKYKHFLTVHERMLVEGARAGLDETRKMLGVTTGGGGGRREAPGRPYLALVEAGKSGRGRTA